MYQHDPQLNVWINASKSSIAYSDGYAIETKIAEVIQNATDLSTLSPELSAHCIDWPSLYHLSPNRANLLRPFSHILKGNVLEIGAGCGALTRYLGELGGNITAIEGSLRRASIIASRTRDLNNVKVICDNFENYQPTELFDAVTLIGVLEYAQLYIRHSTTPFLTLLQQAKRCLKPNGVLVVAIENQLGLKYLAGMSEDHVGKPFFGIQDLYTKNGPVTFGRNALIALIKNAGFLTVECALPFPDYKLPRCVIFPKGQDDPDFEAIELVWPSILQDPQLNFSPVFALPRVYTVMAKNGLLADVANSFLMVASQNNAPISPENKLAVHFSVNSRFPQFTKQAEFIKTHNNSIEIQRTLLRPQITPLPTAVSAQFIFHPSEKETYQQGEMLATQFNRIITTPDWHITQIGAFLKTYLHALNAINQSNTLPNLLTVNTKIPGDLIDAIPTNIIASAELHYTFIDIEWHCLQDIELGYLLFRSLLQLIYTSRFFAKPQNPRWLTMATFFIDAMQYAGFTLTHNDLEHYFLLENQFQHAVSVKPQTISFLQWSMQLLPTYLDTQTLFDPNHCTAPAHNHMINSFKGAVANAGMAFKKTVLRRGASLFKRSYPRKHNTACEQAHCDQ